MTDVFEAWEVPAWRSREGAEPPSRRVSAEVWAGSLTGAGPAAGASELGGTAERAIAVPELEPADVAALAEELIASREALLARPAREIAEILGRAGARFSEAGDALRARALAWLPATSGLSPAMALTVLDGMARDWTADRLERLLRADFSEPGALDGFVTGPEGSRVRAMGPPLAVHVVSGSVPGVSGTSLLRSLLAKTPVLLKPGRGDVVLPTLLLRAVAAEDPELARSAAVAYWPGGEEGSRALEAEALRRAGLVVVYGGNATVADVRSRLRPSTRLVTYRARMSVGIVGSRVFETAVSLEEAAASSALAVALFDQRGCVSPHALFVEEAGKGSAEAFVEALAHALETTGVRLPPGRASTGESSALQQLRGTVQMRAAAGEGVRVREGGGWTIIVDRDTPLEPSPLNRVVRLLPVSSLREIRGWLVPLASHLQSAGVTGVGTDELEGLAEELGRVGIVRVAGMRDVAFPPAWWRHDGDGPLRALVRWVEVEPGSAGAQSSG